MATSSIYANFDIKEKDKAKKFAEGIENTSRIRSGSVASDSRANKEQVKMLCGKYK